MIDYLKWLTAESVLSVHDGRAAPADPGDSRCESLSHSALPPAPPFPVPAARIGFVRQLPARPPPPARGEIATADAEPTLR